MYKLTNIITFCVTASIFFSCTKTVATESTGQPEAVQTVTAAGKVTPVGIPTGAIESRVFSINGGTWTTSDKRLTIKFPQGAVSVNTTVTVQPISNQTPGGTGSAYRITPHGVNFAKPVSITFNYVHDDISATIARALSVAYQDSNGIWQAQEAGANDTVAKKITINTTHFSDWSLFKSYEIIPNIAFIPTGSSILIKVVKRLTTNEPVLPLPAGPVYDTLDASVKSWTLAGAGQLQPAGNKATYTAPLTVPATQPVKATAELATTTGKYLLVTNIFIGNGQAGQGGSFTGQGVVFRVDKGPWKYAICPNGVKVMHTSLGDERYITAFVPGSINADAVSFHWIGRGVVGTTTKWTTTFPDFLYTCQENNSSIYYVQFALPEGTASAGGIKWLATNEVQGGYTSGSFTITTSGKTVAPRTGVPPPPSNHLVDGFFNVVWGGN